MLFTIAVILLVLWLLGLVSGYTSVSSNCVRFASADGEPSEDGVLRVSVRLVLQQNGHPLDVRGVNAAAWQNLRREPREDSCQPTVWPAEAKPLAAIRRCGFQKRWID